MAGERVGSGRESIRVVEGDSDIDDHAFDTKNTGTDVGIQLTCSSKSVGSWRRYKVRKPRISRVSHPPSSHSSLLRGLFELRQQAAHHPAFQEYRF